MRERFLAGWVGLTIGVAGLTFSPPGGASPPAPAAPQAPAASEAVTIAETCAGCHEANVLAFEDDPHARAFRHDDHYAAASCQSCHGDATAHMEAGDGSQIVVPNRLPAAEVESLCMSCHGENAAQTHWQGSAHQRRGVACLDCHSIHSRPDEPAGLEESETATVACYRCHADVRSEMRKVSHHPVREGKMTCSSCHDPHGSLTRGNLRAGSVNDLCYDCHTEKRGPFLWEHAPVRENCLNCHTPHGSNHLKLQSTSVPYICQQCHQNTRHPGTLYDATRLPTLEDPATGSNRLFNRACVDCHALVHGSNHPSGMYLGR